jgi:diguanylate cyclase (GGDEF)-like protein
MNANTRRILIYLIALSLLITTAVAFSLIYNVRANDARHGQLAQEIGRTFFKELVIVRRWNANLGGIYAPITDELQPNPYLDDPQRDLIATNGLKLTKINPAFMTRLLSEMPQHATEGIRFHITSLNPLNPHNEPDTWERRALEHFERGAEEQFSTVEEPQGRVLRFMGRLVTEKSCMTCHAQQGYRVGEVRGGIRVSLPLASFESAATLARQNIVWMHGLFWLTTLSLLWGSGALLLRNVAQLEKLNEYMKGLNQKLESAALTDSLTGIPNRLYFDQQIDANLRAAQRYGVTFSMIMLDLDHFKQVNDQYGHSVGDRVLQEFSQIAKNQLRQTDQLARWGGEEFIIATSHTGLNQALALAERIRGAVADHDFVRVGSVTASIGVAEYRPGETAIALLERVDGALYRAKDNGRNRVEWATS